MAKKIGIEVSPAGSMKGYRFSIWFNRNKDLLKTILMAISGIAVYAVTTYLPVWANLGLAGAVSALVKLGVDAIDFYSSEQVYLK